MSFTLQDQIKGGKAAATDSQKNASRDWAQANRPWLKSTGAITPEGKATAAFNSYKSYFRCKINASQAADFEQECNGVRRFIQVLKKQVETRDDIFFRLKITERRGGEGQGAFAIFDIKITLRQKTTPVDQVWQKLDALVKLRSLLNL